MFFFYVIMGKTMSLPIAHIFISIILLGFLFQGAIGERNGKSGD